MCFSEGCEVRLKHALGRVGAKTCFKLQCWVMLKHGLGRGRAKMCFNDGGVVMEIAGWRCWGGEWEGVCGI